MATFPRRRRIYEACSCMLASYILTYIYIQRKNLCTYIFKRDSVAHVTNTRWIRYRGRFKVSENAFHFSIFVFLFFFFFFFPSTKTFEKAQDENDRTTRIRDDTCLYTEETGLQIKLLLSILNIKHGRC